MREPNPRLCLAAAIVGVLLMPGCSSSNSSTTTPESMTLIQVQPSDFVAKGACGTRLLSYVATLFDVTGSMGISDAGVSGANFSVASTPPKGCDEITVFSEVVYGHAYMAKLQGYALPPTDMAAADVGTFSSSSAMLRKSDSSYVAPIWTASCYGWRDRSGQPQPGYSYEYVTETLSTCSLLGSEP